MLEQTSPHDSMYRQNSLANNVRRRLKFELAGYIDENDNAGSFGDSTVSATFYRPAGGFSACSTIYTGHEAAGLLLLANVASQLPYMQTN